jgi:exosortase A
MTALSNREISDQAMPLAWKAPLFLTALVLGWVLFLYWKTAWSMVATWERSETFAHGFLVLPIVLWLVWRKRASLAEEMPSPSRWAAWALLPIGLAWGLGELAAANVLTQSALVGLLACSVAAILGGRVARKLAFPLGFLAFAVPVGEFLVPRLMDWTAGFTVLGLRLSGVPVYREGLDFVIPSGNWSVVEACSGIRYLIASVMVGTLFAYLNFQSLKRRLAFIAVSLAVPILANWVRAYGIVMVGHLSGNRLATGMDHLIYGWLFFGLVVALLFLIGSRWAEKAPAAFGRPAPPGHGEAPPLRPGDWGAAGIAALVVAVPVLAMATVERQEVSNPPVLEKSLETFAARGWQAVDEQHPAWRPAFREAADSWHRTFERDGRRVGLHIGYYRNQAQGHKLVPPAGGLAGSEDGSWAAAPLGIRKLDMDGKGLAVTGTKLWLRLAQASTQPLVAWQWYWADGAATAGVHRARARVAWSRIRGRGDDAAVVVLHAPAGEAGGEAALEAFSRSAGAAITHLLNETRNRR